MTQHAPFGFWPSSITPEHLTQGASKRSEPQLLGDDIYWLETRPLESGRTALVKYSAETNTTCDLLGSPNSVRTRAQEYGGGSYRVSQIGIFLVLDHDQRIYCFNESDKNLLVISPENTSAETYRYADFCVDETRKHLYAVRETYLTDLPHHHPTTDIICIKLDATENALCVIASGKDFYSNPRLSPSGKQLSYLCWNHPNMPWDATEVHLIDLDETSDVKSDTLIAGEEKESLFQPQWSPTGDLFYVSDKNGWWNIYRHTHAGGELIFEMEAEFATPQWVFGMSSYGFIESDTIFCTYTQQGQWKLALIKIHNKSLTPIDSPFSDVSHIAAASGVAAFIAGSPTTTSAVYKFKDKIFNALTEESAPNKNDISQPQAIQFPTEDGEQAYGFFYTPKREYNSNEQSLPPLIVMAHGGPTGATETTLNNKIQFWTTRGFAVLDVNYRGSTGYGTHFRKRLKNNWGVTDVIDVCSGARHLIDQGKVNPKACFIRGSSAGGYTVLAALTFTDVFSAGTSLYGIGDLSALAEDTHKFEAHYLDSLVGPYPEKKAIYDERSPIKHIEKLKRPVLFLQGLKDKVVPPAQAEAMYNALQSKGIKTEYITFATEGHGFRQAESIVKSLEAELAFYQAFLQEKH